MLSILKRDYYIDYRDSSIVSKKIFFNNWRKYTCNIFHGMDWDGICCAGGAVFHCINNFDMDTIGKDIDLFLFADNDDEARVLLSRISKTIDENYKGKNKTITINDFTVTFNLDYPYKSIQVIRKLFKSPSHLLFGFDIDACTALYDGWTVRATDRFKRAMTKRYNLVDKTRRSKTYEQRLYKYSLKGFSVLIPDMKHAIIDDIDIKQNISSLKGLMKLLKYDQMVKESKDEPYTHILKKNDKYTMDNDDTREISNLDNGELYSITFDNTISYYQHPVDTNGKKLLSGFLTDNTDLTLWENALIKFAKLEA